MAVYPVLFILSNNIGQFYLSAIVKPMLIILGLTLAVWCFLGVVIKNYQKAGIIVSIFLFLFFSYGHVKSLLGNNVSTVGIMLVWLALFVLGIYRTVRWKNPIKKETQIFNVMAGTLVMFSVIIFSYGQLNSIGWHPQFDERICTNENIEQKEKGEYYPDIYFIVLDAYARSDVLNEMYHFDNTDFITYLRNKGFYIAERSAANYCQTGLSIASCFNLCYLDKMVEKYVGQYNLSRGPLKKIITKSIVVGYLKKHGYSIISFETGTFETELTTADIYFRSKHPLNPFLNTLINITPIPDIDMMRKKGDVFDKHRINILSIFDIVGNVVQINRKPKFIYAHINLPHPPFLFGSNGEPIKFENNYNNDDGNWLISSGRLSLSEYRKGYRDQVMFANSKIKKTVDKILSNSRRPPIILLLGDHGPRSKTVWHDPKMTNMKECLANLSAYYLPRGGDKNLYPEITPVNIFAVIFNYYFGEKLDLLPDKSYFSTAQHLYNFYDVTKQIQIVAEKG